jgi:hypothetical protein
MARCAVPVAERKRQATELNVAKQPPFTKSVYIM